MELQINLEYRVRTDEYNIFLEKRRISQKGKTAGQEAWDIVGYYPDIEWALREMLKCEILRSDLQGVQAVVNAVERATEDIKKALSESNIKRLDKQIRDLAMENELLRKKLNKEGDGE